jgi:LAS superfamily LD-carboxypeptidase LdcB
MNRNSFLRSTLIGGIALSLLPHWSFVSWQSKYTRDQLVGKGNPDLSGTDFKMHPDAYIQFLEMKSAAEKENISIEVVSAYRSFERQKMIFENKFLKYTQAGLDPVEAIDKIIEYSTIPGTSRHHWGTDIDIIDANAPRPENVLEPSHFHGTGPYCELKEWLNENANNYDFYEVYTDDPNRKGFKYEPWHFSFAPVSKEMLQSYKELDIKEILIEENILGKEHFSDIFLAQYRKEHILDINPKLL